MGLTQKLGTIPLAIQTDSSNNVGIGGTPSGSFKLEVTGASKLSGILGVNGSPATSFPFEAYINSSTAYSSTSRGNVMRVYNSNTGANIFAGIELGGAGTANDGLAGLNAVVTGSGSAALTFYTRDGGTFAERFRVSASGNVGIGTSNPAAPLDLWKTGGTAGLLASFTDGTYSNLQISTTTTGTILTTTVSSYLAFGTTNAERMRILANGAIGMGNTNPVNGSYAGGYVVTIGNSTTIGNIVSNQTILGNNVFLNTGGAWTYQNTGWAGAIRFSSQAAGDISFHIAPSGTGNTPISGWDTSAIKMYLTNAGFFKSSNDGTYHNRDGNFHEFRSNQNLPTLRLTNSRTSGGEEMLRQEYTGFSPNSSNSWFIYSNDTSAARFYVSSNGGIGNFQSNNVNLSDIRTKKDIIPLESYWDKFKAIEIVKFKYKDQTHDDFNIGVIAQQIESVAPEFVDIDGFGMDSIPDDGVPLKTIYTADLYHATIKVLQEAMAKIEELNAKVTALENK